MNVGLRMRMPDRGFVNPAYMILITLIGIGVALAVPILRPLLHDEPISVWHWIGLGSGTFLILACLV